jgi:hypothetical protein
MAILNVWISRAGAHAAPNEHMIEFTSLLTFMILEKENPVIFILKKKKTM